MTHEVSSIQPVATPSLSGHDGGMIRVRSPLERFWPSRRGHAFDEFCR